jgi:diadenylate cyclase
MEELASFSIINMRWQDLLDIILVAFAVYQILLLVRGTRAMHVLVGLAIILVLRGISQHLELWTLNWIISAFVSSIIIILVILFQTDIKRVLMQMGQRSPLGKVLTSISLRAVSSESQESADMVEEVVRTSVSLASSMTGGLIVIERLSGLDDIIEIGTQLDAIVDRELLLTIFWVGTPLHDGAVVISSNRLAAARCVLPLSPNPSLARHLGTRHRAAIGITEETDAICVVVSEERGLISVAESGQLYPDLDAVALRNILFEQLGINQERKSLWRRIRGG